ncbi:MAG: RimK/LysX family protein [Parvularculaceae bacterium]
MSDKVVIGWREKITLPDWGVRLRAKVDTSARTSSLDVRNLRVEDGIAIFEIPVGYRTQNFMEIRAPVICEKSVNKGAGEIQDRIIIPVKVVIRSREKVIELTLASPRTISHRLLLGRRALEGDFLVVVDQDPA